MQVLATLATVPWDDDLLSQQQQHSEGEDTDMAATELSSMPSCRGSGSSTREAQRSLLTTVLKRCVSDIRGLGQWSQVKVAAVYCARKYGHEPTAETVA